jgi:hypothetical protein
MTADGQWYIVIEENIGSGENRQWRPSAHAVGDRETALAAALHTARSHRPRHPMTEQHRQVLRVSEETYVVLVQGMTGTYHFRVSVGELV